ncbi:MAG: hypothetical protein HKM22_05920 [Gammaproteobacteria bacterium]|nr:hypothetical protein [Gammaproteobacteria bacterium]
MNNISRAAPISAICFIWVLLTVFQLYQLFLIAAELPTWSKLYIIGIATTSLIAIAGIWQMKKWGLMLFIGMFVLNQAVALVQGQWHINTLLLPLLVIAVAIAHIKQFR